jgi:heat shock protein HtpX
VGRTLLVVRNVLKAWLLLLAAVAVFGGIGWLIGGLRGLEIFVFCALLLALAGYWYADRAVLGLVGARELPLGEAPALHSTVGRLAALSGVAAPKLYVLPDSFPRAFATGRGPHSSSLAVSSGLVAVCSPAELEGVLAHELAHVRHRDVLIATTVVLAGVSLVEGSRAGGFLQRALLFVLAPVAAATEHLFLSPKREFEADRAAAELLGSPHGLADALLRLDQASELVPFEASPATEPLYTVNPFAVEGLARMFDTHPPLGERIGRLRGLDPDWRAKLRAA